MVDLVIVAGLARQEWPELAQRLVRTICPECRQEYDPDPADVPGDFTTDPGTTLYDSRRRYAARVRVDGTLVSESLRGSIHKVGAELQVRIAVKRLDEGLLLSRVGLAPVAPENVAGDEFEIEARQQLDDAAAIKVLSTLVKQRREAAEAYRTTRPELADKEEQELAVLQEFLPAQLSEGELEELVARAITASGAGSVRDMGAVMKLVTPQTTGRADGRLVSEIVRKQLAR